MSHVGGDSADRDDLRRDPETKEGRPMSLGLIIVVALGFITWVGVEIKTTNRNWEHILPPQKDDHE